MPVAKQNRLFTVQRVLSAGLIPELRRAGADECVVGRALVDDPDPARVLRDLRAVTGLEANDPIST